MKIPILLCLLYLLITQPIYSQIQNDLAVFNLKGNVKTLRIEKSKFITEGNEKKENKREPQELITFDENGYYTERVGLANSVTRRFAYQYYPDGKIKEKTDLVSSESEVYIYLQNLVVKNTQLKDGHILDRRVYTFDETGKIIKEQYTLIDKNLGQRFFSPSDIVVYKYDSQERLFETGYFNANGTGATFPIFSLHRYVNVYDDKNRVIVRQVYKPDGNLIFKWIFKYNEKEYLEETLQFSQTLMPLSKVVYSDFDSNGNWTKKSTFNISGKEGQTTVEPTEVEYRTITYYP